MTGGGESYQERKSKTAKIQTTMSNEKGTIKRLENYDKCQDWRKKKKKKEYVNQSRKTKKCSTMRKKKKTKMFNPLEKWIMSNDFRTIKT